MSSLFNSISIISAHLCPPLPGSQLLQQPVHLPPAAPLGTAQLPLNQGVKGGAGEEGVSPAPDVAPAAA